MERTMPKHPELWYRATGEWTSWSDFLGADNEENREAEQQDRRMLEMATIPELYLNITDPKSEHGDFLSACAIVHLRPDWFSDEEVEFFQQYKGVFDYFK
jgi:hypothetical protein